MKRHWMALGLVTLLLASSCTKKEDQQTAASMAASTAEHAALESQSAASEQDNVGSMTASSSTSSTAPPLTTRFTVPEGYTFARMGLMLEEKGICTAQEWMQAAQTGDFSEFPLVAAQTPDENLCFELEGYLFPDTYEIYTGESPDAILRRMLARTEQVITEEMRAQIKQSGYTSHEILALASIIEKEALGPAEMKNISSVLHNRLEQKMRLQCDVTIKYVEGAVKPFIEGDVDRYNEHYNTYKCSALPAGPICSPSRAAIEAAISPADTPYLFFLTDSAQNYLYSETYEAHQENVKKAGIS